MQQKIGISLTNGCALAHIDSVFISIFLFTPLNLLWAHVIIRVMALWALLFSRIVFRQFSTPFSGRVVAPVKVARIFDLFLFSSF